MYTFAEVPVTRPGDIAVLEGGVAIFALVVEYGVVVEPLRLRLQVPLAHQPCVVAGSLQCSGYGG